ncbi:MULTISPECIES: glutamate--cysteine ligase [Candidatus Neomicrothrix]|jgi:carboxylate-amine ligase|uniref:glutamate--cysteine ligase n=1 Tax=Candidatus Neomicrothrix TaxID=41949 RepID=UPI000373CDAA|nr:MULTISPECIES: glutamate--cysteine ligase [Microthrix]NLH66195.1 glutamate--cysteine ligase [Candidatus Microthrix parvicella]MBK7018081.1 glutamate--cysteine ligase [Candidatus Microthrix sp.]MBK7323408.1 glutamate--cysteine ligase [Candidatus Microthrix sp.]MBL0204790.1 glutamate--cysteine ligase [Candidatus Microthrix sp.]MBP6134082.1 glutamate--cysteine ligase [Candidatus Microthrix sp.]
MTIEFHSSPTSSLGVEVELSLVDRETHGLTAAATDTLADVEPDDGSEHPALKHELFESTVETITGICDTVSDARRDLEAGISELRQAADARGVGLLCSGTHPFSSYRDLQVSPSARYQKLLDEMQWPVRRLAIYGIHYHVGVRSAEKCVATVNSLTTYLPVFLALSASSPFWHGYDTGLASARTKIFEGLPTAGLPPRLTSWVDFEAFLDALIRAEAIESVREVWWDVRPHPDFGTVELRMCDGMPTMTEICGVASLAQCLVAWMDAQIDNGVPLPGVREWVVRQNKWLAARHGLDAQLIVDDNGNRKPARQIVDELVELLSGTAARLGCSDELASLSDLVRTGNSAERQRRIVAQGGTLVDVTAALQQELLTDAPVG